MKNKLDNESPDYNKPANEIGRKGLFLAEFCSPPFSRCVLLVYGLSPMLQVKINLINEGMTIDPYELYKLRIIREIDTTLHFK